MSVFNLNEQNSNLDNKIVAGLERISQVFKTLLWEKSKAFNLSPIQIQLLIFIQHHASNQCTVSYLAQEFNISKPTVSETIKILEQKKYIQKVVDAVDTRSYRVILTARGEEIVFETESFTNPLTEIVSQSSIEDKITLWKNISSMILQLNKMNIITIQRSCYNCHYFSNENDKPFCGLLNQELEVEAIRMDCGEFNPA
ncbi:MarR family winged helix-turn-helix transcriptional regulator [Flavobacterium sp. UMI-01]|uniref:MarR family winged helix-turn-helix transcriptional regulator n=1 Tax=Flavobacterium sp. UMI-01 TaxID=1441053 RepID=UPI001C7DA413|nr:MarR family winged helix-turn-helix transcriptional regulator [Flavobacterium sp. UMI-01]